MGELLGITGGIGSGKTTLARLLGEFVENHAVYETGGLVIEVANRFNQLLEAELNFETTDDATELVNQALIWMPDVITEVLHRDTTWNQLAITPKGTRAHPELYEKLFAYIARIRKMPRIVEHTISSENKADYRDILQWLGGYLVAKSSPTIWYDELFRRIGLHDTRRNLVIITGVRYISDAAAIREHGGRVIRIVRNAATSVTDVTEAEGNQIEPDVTVKNNGTPEDLQKTVELLWNDIAAAKPQPVYG